VLEGDRIAGVSKEGDTDACIDLPPGPVTVSAPRGATEWALNIGEKRFVEILVELKD